MTAPDQFLHVIGGGEVHEVEQLIEVVPGGIFLGQRAMDLSSELSGCGRIR